MVALCVPVFRKYDTLKLLIESAEMGIVSPSEYLIVDNGTRFNMADYGENVQYKIRVISPGRNIGVAAAWNIFIKETEKQRVISNDDVSLYPDTFRDLIETKGDFVFTDNATRSNKNMFSFFLIRDRCVEKTGLFDEEISPNYGYFEDNDYFRRMSMSGVHYVNSRVLIDHIGSATIATYSNTLMREHHDKFRLARNNYIKKWGGLPDKEVFRTPYNR